MTYGERESSIAAGEPFELYQFITDVQQWRITSADKERSYQGRIYTPEVIMRTATSQSAEEKGGHIKVTLPKESEIAQLFVAYIPSTPLYLTIYRCHDGDSETVVAFTGRVLSAQFTADDTCELDCAPESELLKRNIASACYQKPCNHILFDAGCTVDKKVWHATALLTLVSSDGLTLKASAFAGHSDGWWSTGYIELGSDRRMVIAHAGDTVMLMTPLVGLAAGMNIDIYPGCDRTYDGTQGCQSKFSNGTNFSGFQWIPSKNPFSSGVA